jgi:RNAse (barnase) inhibitor barstar
MSKLYTLYRHHFVSDASQTFVAVIDGKRIPTLDDFYPIISKALQFPDYFGENLDALDEMLHQLDWIEQPHVLLLIINSLDFLITEHVRRDAVLSLFRRVQNPDFEVCLL